MLVNIAHNVGLNMAGCTTLWSVSHMCP